MGHDMSACFLHTWLDGTNIEADKLRRRAVCFGRTGASGGVVPPERGKGGLGRGRGSAEVRYFQRLEKATPANHRATTSVCITLTKTTCPALNTEACKENRPRVVVSICTTPSQPARRDFAIAIWS